MTTKPQSTTEPLEPCPFGPPPEHLPPVIKEVNGAEGTYWWAGCEIHLSPNRPPQGCGVGHSALTKEEAIRKWNTRAPTAPVVDEDDQLHLAICQAVHLMNQGDLHAGHDLLRQTLIDYADKKAPLTRSEIVRQQQRSGSSEVSAIMVSPAAATAAPQVVSDFLRDAGAIIIINEGGAGARVEIRFTELRDAQRLHKTLIQSRATAAPVEQSDSLLAKITQIADIGSAEEFGDAVERLRAIRKLIATTNEGAR